VWWGEETKNFRVLTLYMAPEWDLHCDGGGGNFRVPVMRDALSSLDKS